MTPLQIPLLAVTVGAVALPVFSSFPEGGRIAMLSRLADRTCLSTVAEFPGCDDLVLNVLGPG